MKTFILSILFLPISGWLYAQHDIKGRVLSMNDLPIEGASVALKGTNQTVATNHNGAFIIQTMPNANTAILEVNHVGYEPVNLIINLPQNDNLTIFLRTSSNLLNEVEVVSTGYQKIPKERATGSFSAVSNELFNQQVGTDILSRLPAVVNSLVIDHGRQGDPQMMIRGLSTISGPKDPLIILDNFPYDGDIKNINPNIVENITILKDASASSIWGTRAANGVIVITTKGSRFNRPTTISFNSNVTIGAKPDLGYIRQMSSSDYIDMEKELFSRNFYNSQINSNNRPVISPVVDLLYKVRSGTLTQDEADERIQALRTVDAREQFNAYMYKPSIKQQYFLNAQGGVDNFSWISSIGYDHNKESLGNTYQRINLRFQNTYQPIEKLSLTTNLYYTQTHNQSGRYGYNNVSMKGNAFTPYMQMADAQGNALPVVKNWNQSYIEAIGDGKLLDWNYYPLTDWKFQTSTGKVSDVLATMAVDYQVVKGLGASLNYQYERQMGLNTSLADENSYMARDYINRFTQIDDENTVYIVPRGGILGKSNSILNSNNLRGQLSFDNTYNRHNVIAIAGTEIRSVNTDGHQERFYGYNPNNLTTGAVDFTKAYPNILTRGSSFVQRNQSLSEMTTRFVSYFSNAAYTFDNRYVFSVSARRDASNLFGLKTHDQWNPFWSAGLGWKLSNEKFYSFNSLPYLNFRATYGSSGNVNPAMVAVNTITYSSNNSPFNGGSMAWFNNYYNPQLKWETSKMLNLAIDFLAKNDRITGSVEYYRKKGENLFGVAPLDYTAGVDPYMLRNVASMKGNGWDFELKSLNANRSFKWQSILNFSLYKDQVVDYLIERSLAIEYVSSHNVPISGIQGKPVFAMYAFKWAGLDPAGEAQGYLNGEMSKNYSGITGTQTKVEDLEYFGSAIPTKYGSLINALSYRDLNLQIGISFKFGYSFRRSSVNYTDLFNNWNGHSDYALRWQKPGDELVTNVPANPYTTNNQRDAFYNGSSVLVEKGDHIRLQYINLSYNLKMPKGGSNRIKGMQVYFNTNNLGLLWKANKADIDPDFNIGAFNVLPPTNYSLGIKTRF